MENYMGRCIYCGHERGVMAESQEQADAEITASCSCSGAKSAEKLKQVNEKLRRCIGDKTDRNIFLPVEDDVYSAISCIAEMIINGQMDAATFAVEGTKVTISRGKDKVKVKRTRVYEQREEIE